jgi:endonuclease/exonuclease/phosphatase family metal-dependent hydrolase
MTKEKLLMNISTNFVRVWLLALLFSSPLKATVDNSIISQLTNTRQIKNIDQKKYSQNQYKVISDALTHKTSIIRVATYNMLYDRYDHLLPASYRWKERLPRIVELIDDMHADLICFQELYPKQMSELLEEIGDDYFLAGPIPCQEDEPEEFNGILIRKGRFQCQEVSTWYISETPKVASSDPYSKEQKSVTEAHLTDWVSGKELAILSTHTTFGSADSREYAAKLLANHTEPLCKTKSVILAGDFNTFTARLDQPLLPYFDGNYMLKLLAAKSLRNSRDAALIGTLGPLSTYTNKEGALMPFQGQGTPGVFLDHIFVGGSLLVLVHAVQPATVNGLYASSHMPVVIDCINFQ